MINVKVKGICLDLERDDRKILFLIKRATISSVYKRHTVGSRGWLF
jgi:hypothetical protein